MGHVLRKSNKPIEKVSRNPFKNAFQMIRRYRVKPSKDQEVTLTMNDVKYVTRSNRKGFFEFKINTPKAGAVRCHLRVGAWNVEDRLELIVQDPEVIIVSDIDDTILVSHSTNLIKKLYLLLTKNHERRRGYDGIKHFYQQLLGDAGKLFYVSSSEWNLYDFLVEFMSFNKMPDGVFLLQDLKSGLLDLFKSGGGSHLHKVLKINKLLDLYPDSRFILVGDSGQRDPDIYWKVVNENPGRIEQVFIRDVKKSHQHKLKNLEADLTQHGVSFQILNK